MKFIRHPLSLLLSTTLLLVGCEGGGITGTGFDKPPISVGVITNFGSVLVNGVKFDTANSKFSLDDVEGLETDLKVGMIVSIVGSINADGTTGSASFISFEDDVEGRVISNSVSTNNKLNIMGQTIHIDADTTFESNISSITTIEEVADGNIVEVSGYNSGDGNIYATRVEVKKELYTQGEAIEVTGLVKFVNGNIFQIGELSIDASNAEFEHIPENTIREGQFVEVKSKSGFDASDNLIADKVELEGDGKKKFSVEENQDLELEGIITELDKVNATFILNGQKVHFVNGTQLSQFSNGQKVKVEGHIQNGILIVSESEVETKLEANITAAGFVDDVNASKGTLTLFGQTISVTTATTMKDEEHAEHEPLRSFTIENIQIGDYVDISAYHDTTNGIWVATRLERDDPEDDSMEELRGTIDEVGEVAGSLVVSGVAVDASYLQGIDFRVGQELELEGSYNGQEFVANGDIEINE